jgi:hypothetical protein
MAIQNSLVGSTNTLAYDSDGANAITSIIICNLTPFDAVNPTADTYNFSLFIVPALEVSGTTTLLKHTIVNAIPITAGETLSLDQEKLVLSDNDRLIAVSNGLNKLSITVSSLVV